MKNFRRGRSTFVYRQCWTNLQRRAMRDIQDRDILCHRSPAPEETQSTNTPFSLPKYRIPLVFRISDNGVRSVYYLFSSQLMSDPFKIPDFSCCYRLNVRNYLKKKCRRTFRRHSNHYYDGHIRDLSDSVIIFSGSQSQEH